MNLHDVNGTIGPLVAMIVEDYRNQYAGVYEFNPVLNCSQGCMVHYQAPERTAIRHMPEVVLGADGFFNRARNAYTSRNLEMPTWLLETYNR